MPADLEHVSGIKQYAHNQPYVSLSMKTNLATHTINTGHEFSDISYMTLIKYIPIYTIYIQMHYNEYLGKLTHNFFNFMLFLPSVTSTHLYMYKRNAQKTNYPNKYK